MGLCFLIILSMVLMIMDHRYHRLNQLRSHLYYLAYPIQLAVDMPIRFTQTVTQYVHSHAQLVRENQALQATQFLQEARLQQLKVLESENEKLRSLLQSPPKVNDIFKVAEIIQVDSDPFNHRIILDKGKEQGVYLGQPLIDAHGIMGEIIDVYSHTSQAMLISDASHAIPIENLRTGTRGIVVGTGAIDSLMLQHVPMTADLQVGDILVTSGLGGRFPAGYMVGKINAIDFNTGESFAQVAIKPAAHLERGRQVLLIRPAKMDLNAENDVDAKK